MRDGCGDEGVGDSHGDDKDGDGDGDGNGDGNSDGSGDGDGDGNLLENKLLQFGRGGDEPDITVLFHLIKQINFFSNIQISQIYSYEIYISPSFLSTSYHHTSQIYAGNLLFWNWKRGGIY